MHSTTYHNSRLSAFVMAGLTLATITSLSAASPTDQVADDRPVLELTHKKEVKVVFQVTTGDIARDMHKGLVKLKAIHADFVKAGVPSEQINIHAVFHGAAAAHLLTDDAWNRYQKANTGNPSTALINELAGLGVKLELCNNRRIKNGWAKSDVSVQVQFAPNAYLRLVDLQAQGYAYVRL